MLTPQNAAVNRDRITGLFDRLHKANFFQGSVGPRNVIVQPGPLTRRPAGRSLDSPSFRIISFGHGECLDEVAPEYMVRRSGRLDMWERQSAGASVSLSI